MVVAPACKIGCITTKGAPSRHHKNRCPLVRREKIGNIDLSGIHLHFVKLTADELARLQTIEPPPQTTGPISTAIT